MEEHKAVESLFEELCLTTNQWMLRHKEFSGPVLLAAVVNFSAWAIYVTCKNRKDHKLVTEKFIQGATLALDYFLAHKDAKSK
jgi:hypothetical protein